MQKLPKLSSEFSNRILDLHGEGGKEWLDGLPALIASIEELWGLQVEDPFPDLTYNFVAPVILEDGKEAILKLEVPGVPFEREAECLRRYAGHGAALLLGYDGQKGSMLLEKVRPGTSLKHVSESEAIEAAVSVMRQIHSKSASKAPMPDVHDWFKGFRRLRDRFHGTTGPLPEKMVAEAQGIFAELAASMAAPVLLHGDLHHENILAGDRLPWIAIDPQGVIGEPAYEVAAFLRNPMPDLLKWPDLSGILERRIAAFSELMEIDRMRIAGWGYSQAVLSGIWSIEDHGAGWEGALEVAHILRKFAIT